jgi:hypothetical protein
MQNKALLIFILCYSICKSQVFTENFNSSSISTRWGYELANNNRMEIVSNPNGIIGDSCMKISMHNGDVISNHCRDEVKLSNNDSLNTIVEYRLSFLLPVDFLDTLPYPFNSHIILQFHQSPIPSQNWSNCNCGGQPMFAITVRKQNTTRHILTAIYGRNVVVGNDTMLNVIAATDTLDLSEKGKWIDLILRFNWSLDSSGYVELWKDAKPWSTFNGVDHKVYGPNMVNFVPVIYKMGLYRVCGNPTFNSIYFDNFSIKNNLSSCPRPERTSVSTIKSNSALISWEYIPEALLSYTLMYRVKNTSTWSYKTLQPENVSYLLQNLDPNTTYEFCIKSVCSLDNKSNYSQKKEFVTLPICSIPSSFSTSSVNDQSQLISWNAVENADYYIIQYHLKNNTNWIYKSAISNERTITGLLPNSIYEYKVKSYCGIDSVSSYSTKQAFCFQCNEYKINNININELVLSPNPAKDFLNVKIDVKNEEIVIYKIFNLFGEIVYFGSKTCSPNNSNFDIDISLINKGCYIFEIKGKEFLLKKQIFILN